MKTIKKVKIDAIHYPEILPEYSELRDGVIYISDEYQTSIHKCLCGCGEKVVLPFNSKGWHFEETNKGITIKPSIGNYSFKCKSHYIITNGVANFV